MAVVASASPTPGQQGEVTWRPKGPIFGEIEVVAAVVVELILVAVLAWASVLPG